MINAENATNLLSCLPYSKGMSMKPNPIQRDLAVGRGSIWETSLIKRDPWKQMPLLLQWDCCLDMLTHLVISDVVRMAKKSMETLGSLTGELLRGWYIFQSYHQSWTLPTFEHLVSVYPIWRYSVTGT